MAKTRVILLIVACWGAGALVGCGDDDDTTVVDAGNTQAGSSAPKPVDSGTGKVDSGTGKVDSGTATTDSGTATTDSGTGTAVGDAQTPPTNAADVDTWLAAGDYKKWTCEPKPHAARSPSPHGFNRICSNDMISNDASGTADWPKGAAAVKERYASANATKPVGYAVYLKTEANSDGGANWYWYERVPLDSPTMHDADGIVADGMGDQGTAMSYCVSCHSLAGTDAAHTPSPGSRDYVYSPVK